MLNICPFCGSPGEKVNAHIIPKAFFKAISQDGDMLKQRELGVHSKKVPIGIYDDSVWCRSCEIEYGRWDAYAAKVLLQSPIEEFISQPAAYELKIDKNSLGELKLFFISLLWRASSSNKRIYENVSIGPFAEKAKVLLKSGLPGFLDDFSTIISCSDADESLISEPVRVRNLGVLFYRFHLGKYSVDIKVSNQPTPEVLLPAVIGQKDVLVILRTKRNSQLVGSVSKIAKDQLPNHSTGPARKGAQAGKFKR
ncbi:hypothetical protein [Quatrionicoccus australiensis]|uniref:hypothetical protein n=1 Tax=Quatrionicoccus australiensis TaxID=138118 RepID=UPI001CF873A5|nr:hypothetical protein [Quatrionicoccus australiensis]UCV13335.1 hypothetical protein KI612_10115 [Quatrionicoccus australiensis]